MLQSSLKLPWQLVLMASLGASACEGSSDGAGQSADAAASGGHAAGGEGGAGGGNAGGAVAGGVDGNGGAGASGGLDGGTEAVVDAAGGARGGSDAGPGDSGATADAGVSEDATAVDGGSSPDMTAPTEDSGAAPLSDAGPVGDPPLIGGFQVQLVEPVPAYDDVPATPGFTSVVGRIYEAQTPTLFIWELSQISGDCQLLTPRVPFCSVPCGGGAACVEDEVCLRYPSAVDVGTVHVTGLRTNAGDEAFDMDPVARNYQQQLPYPPSAEGARVTFSAAGGELAPFSLESEGISPLELVTEAFPLDRGAPLVLEWTPPLGAGNSAVHVKLDISHHGGTKGMIDCDTADDGQFELDAVLVDALLDLGFSGFPTVILSRRAVGSTQIAAGRVDLTLSSTLERSVEIAGLVSCFGDEQCAAGQVCAADLTCQPDPGGN